MKNELKKIFNERLRFKSATGIDRLRPEAFEEKLDKNLDYVEEKYLAKKYKFQPYKELLIIKGRNKIPRMVSIPTVRDKLFLSWTLKKVVVDLNVKFVFIYELISKIREQILSGKTYYVKLDVSGFYDNINHELLLGDLRVVVKNELLLDVLEKAIKNPTTCLNVKTPSDFNSKGVPQGIPISNVLADFFAKRIDSFAEDVHDVYYVRYVDDILLLSSSEISLKKHLVLLRDKIRSCGLEFNAEKEVSGELDQGVDFLGYNFKLDDKNKLVSSIRKSSYQKHYLSILKLFTIYKNGKITLDRFTWDLNLKITGAILDKDRYGWLFFFSQVDEDSFQLHALDKFVDYQLKIHQIDRGKSGIKKYSRAIKEIRRNLSKIKYIPNFDKYTHDQKKDFLTKSCGITENEIRNLGPSDIDYYFMKNVYRQIRVLERDVGSVS